MDQVVVYRHNTLCKGGNWDAVGCYAKMVGFVQGSVQAPPLRCRLGVAWCHAQNGFESSTRRSRGFACQRISFVGSRIDVISPYTHPGESGYAPHWPNDLFSGDGVNHPERRWGSAGYCDCVAVRGDDPVAGAAVHGNIGLPIIIKINLESPRGEGILKFYAALLRNRISEFSREGGRRSAGRGDATPDSTN